METPKKMAEAEENRCRLCIVTPPAYEPRALAERLKEALAGGDVASLIVTAPKAGDPAAHQKAAELLVPLAVAAGTAALVHMDTRIAMRTGADGVHVDGAEAVEAARGALGRDRIVGVGDIRARHDAMDIGSDAVDYLFFGRLDGDTGEGIFPKALDLAEWWSAVTVVPAIVMGGRDLASVETANARGIAFVALSSAIFDDPRGPRAAVADATARLQRAVETAA
jgi:thiamine-phosphate pyrophosphorylase